MSRHASFAVLLVLGAFTRLQGAEEPPPMDWRQAATKAGLAAEEVDRLGKDKVLVSRQEVKQSFSAYIGGELPNFITSDALLNAHHVLFEETLRELEEVNAAELRRYVPELWKAMATMGQHYTGDARLISAAQQRARFVLGVATKLLGEDVSSAAEPLRRAIEAEAEATVKAEGQHKPEWLGPPEPDFIAFDYTVFRPAGFYVGKPQLENYFRAVRWLQLVPFRAGKDEEAFAMRMIQETKDNAGKELPEAEREALQKRLNGWGWHEAAEAWKAFGIASGIDVLAETVDDFGVGGGRVPFPDAVEEGEGHPQRPHDRIRDSSKAKTRDGELRLIAALNLPEQEALFRCAKIGQEANPPGGLEFAAWLGHPSAEALLQAGPARERLAVLVKAWDGVDEEAGVCWAQLHALRGLWVLNDRAPAFMRGDPWQKKTMLTITSSWAQQRHAWALQANVVLNWESGFKRPKSLIEPSTEFFERLASVCSAMAGIAEKAEKRRDAVETVAQELATMEQIFRTEKEGSTALGGARERLETLSMFLGFSVPDFYNGGTDVYAKVADAVALVRKRLSAGDAEMTRAIARSEEILLPNHARDWSSLATTCLRLALLSHKQLDGRPFSSSESKWLDNIGTQFAHCMLYEGNSFMHPFDDAPRIARVSSDARDGSVMQVGIGRPRLLYVLYPWEGTELLCRGAVMPYHEVSDRKSLTDQEWRVRFEGETRPLVPEWLKDFVPVEGVKLRERGE